MLGFSITFISLFSLFVAASPTFWYSFDVEQALRRSPALQLRGTPYFPPNPPSCPICAQNFSSINSCAQAAPVLANFSNVIFNPGAFIDIIKCACADTFQSAYPQCADCFVQTNQTELLNCNTQDLPGIIQGMRQVCALESTLTGNVSYTNGEATPSPKTAAPTPTSGALARSVACASAFLLAWAIAAGILDLMLW